ncbi:MAG TPA: carbamoyltransferase HypF [Gammaproteobacteria bacterium]|nr:carbamoyltransferase HypF [Gammaproteobacteria bacterium]
MSRAPAPSSAADPVAHAGSRTALRLTLTGRVQGVGFRPFVYRQAQARGLAGWVCNRGGTVLVHAEGPPEALESFAAALVTEAPPLARPVAGPKEPVPAQCLDGFRVLASDPGDTAAIHLPPDQFACGDCLAELSDPGDRRYRYPFINCTQCGPRYTIIRGLPYDRPRTSMAEFPLCPACRAEYANPLDRRFHAEPLACPECGPRLRWHARDLRLDGNEPSLAACLDALRQGRIVAVRGIGGYHLVCDAADEAAVRRLRGRKHRPHKPLAVMVPMTGPDGLETARSLAELDDLQAGLLRDPLRPIVLAPRREGAPLAPSIAPGLADIGLMLPYSPLHQLLLDGFGAALVMTSGNLSGEPVLTDPEPAETRLASVADAFLHHNRPIVRPADDPVYVRNDGRMRPLRLGRGNAPGELELPRAAERPLLAWGAYLKNTVALAWDRRVVVSPHLGDLGTARGRELVARVARDLQALYGVAAEQLACDAHPGFPTHRQARDSGLPVHAVLHHHAHASALAGELGLPGPMLVFAWDGVGYGEDGTLWGGEALVGEPGRWRRAGSLRPFRLPGGDRVVAEPWRTAAALAWETGRDWQPPEHAAPGMLFEAWQRGLNSPLTSAAGRLFDGAAALAGVTLEASFEGQGPMALEAIAVDAPAVPLPLGRDPAGVWRLDWEPLVALMCDESLSRAARAGRFHASLAAALAEQAARIAGEHGLHRVGLTGGVFQNRRLTTLARHALEARGFEVLLPAALPVNDAGISYGQVIEALARQPNRSGGPPCQ